MNAGTSAGKLWGLCVEKWIRRIWILAKKVSSEKLSTFSWLIFVRRTIFFFFPPSSSWKIPSLFYCYLIVFHYQTINSNTKFIKGIKYQKNKEAKIALLIILLLVVLHKLINFNRPGPRLLFENIFSGFENNFIVDRFYISMRLIIN